MKDERRPAGDREGHAALGQVLPLDRGAGEDGVGLADRRGREQHRNRGAVTDRAPHDHVRRQDPPLHRHGDGRRCRRGGTGGHLGRRADAGRRPPADQRRQDDGPETDGQGPVLADQPDAPGRAARAGRIVRTLSRLPRHAPEPHDDRPSLFPPRRTKDLRLSPQVGAQITSKRLLTLPFPERPSQAGVGAHLGEL